jgi:thiol-disulfide isomerase/thioredoxin
MNLCFLFVVEYKMKKKIKKELIEWIILLSFIGIVFIGGWHTQLIGGLQGLLLKTGIMTPQLTNERIKVENLDLELERLDGKRVSLSDFEDQVIFMNFWATWCPPCIAEMPDIHDLYLEKAKDVTFLMISVDDNEEKARAYISKNEFEFPVYFLRSKVPAAFKSNAIPTTFVLNKKNELVVKNSGMARYNTGKFRRFLDELNQDSVN